MPAMTASELYLYAIVPSGDQVLFDIAGVGNDSGEVYTIPYHPADSSARPLAAVVSPSPIPDYHGLKRPEAAAYLIAHQRVVELVMRGFSTLPVKFGTVMKDKDQVLRMLAQGQAGFLHALDKYGSKVQMELVVLWNIEYVFQKISQDERIQAAKAQVVASPAEDSLAKKVALGKLVQAILEEQRAALANDILPYLQEIAGEIIANPLMNDGMVLNLALLLDEDGTHKLDRTLETLDALFEARGYTGGASLVFRRVGPLPPYSFTTIEIQSLNFEVVDNARKLLELQETTTIKEIQHAYHRQVIRQHPDLHPEQLESDDGITRLTQAYRLLSNYAESQYKMTPDVCSLDRESVSQAILISVQRPDSIPA